MQRTQESLVDQPANDTPCAVLNAEVALLLCFEAWGFPELASSRRSPWRWLDSRWQERLDDTRRKLGPHDAEHALDLLRLSHRFQCRADPGRVHSTWWTRALQDESPAVRSFIALHGPAPVCAAARDGLSIGREAVESHLPDPAVAGWVLSLSTERLVGGEPVRFNEPPVLVALAALSSRELYRLSHASGQAKAALAGDPHGIVAGRPLDGERKQWFHDWFSDQLGPEEARPQTWAQRDLQGSRGTEGLGRRRRLASLGLSTFARLLAGCEPYRVRWSLQHLPYPVAKRIRSIMSVAPTVSDQAQRLEIAVLQAAWTRLTLENRLSVRHPEETMRPDHAC
jgi:hypothetical protein